MSHAGINARHSLLHRPTPLPSLNIPPFRMTPHGQAFMHLIFNWISPCWILTSVLYFTKKGRMVKEQSSRRPSRRRIDMECSNSWWIIGDQGEFRYGLLNPTTPFLSKTQHNRYTFLQESSTAPVVPFRHDEYPRFITGAWPFYSGALSVTAAFLLFCGLWLFTAEGPVGKAGKGKKAE
jgi:hypothetical protein